MYVDPDEEVEALRQEYYESLKNDPKVIEYMAPYREVEVERVLRGYALSKARLKKHGNYTNYHQQYLIEEWTKCAWVGLKEIQQFKLFKEQCLWRAEQRPPLDGIEITSDFVELKSGILDYKGIPPISADELDDYISFLKNPRGRISLYYYGGDYQDYERIKERVLEGDDTWIEFYDFMFTKYGQRDLLMLPDVRGEKEEKYAQKAFDLRRAAHKKKQENEPPKPKVKSLGIGWEAEIKFAEYLGERKVAAFIKDLDAWVKIKPDFNVGAAVDYLMQCYPDPVPIKGNDNWQEAVMEAVEIHKTMKTIEVLPSVYSEYQMKYESNIPMEPKKSETGVAFRGWYRTAILDGREAFGEPRNFDF